MQNLERFLIELMSIAFRSRPSMSSFAFTGQNYRISTVIQFVLLKAGGKDFGKNNAAVCLNFPAKLWQSEYHTV